MTLRVEPVTSEAARLRGSSTFGLPLRLRRKNGGRQVGMSHTPAVVGRLGQRRCQATTFLTWKASASRDGALHSTPRSLSSDQNVSSSNHGRLAWEGNASNNPAILSRHTSS